MGAAAPAPAPWMEELEDGPEVVADACATATVMAVADVAGGGCSGARLPLPRVAVVPGVAGVGEEEGADGG